MGNSLGGKNSKDNSNTKEETQKVKIDQSLPKHFSGIIHRRNKEPPQIEQNQNQIQNKNEIDIPAEDDRKKLDKRPFSKLRKGDELQGDLLYENIKKIYKKKTANDYMFIMTCLKNHFVFYNLSEAELENIVSKMFYCEVERNEFIFKQGDNASSYFILEKGALEVIVNDKPKRELKPGDGFGELALLYNAPRSASVKTLESCYLWGIDRITFRKAVEEMITKEYEENRKFIDLVRFFNSMTTEQKDALAGGLIAQKIAKGQNIVNEGDPASSFFIIKEGSAVVLKGNKEVRRLMRNDSFGEQALYYNTVRQMSVKALDDVKVLALGRDTVTRILGDQVQVITFRNLQKWAFEKSPLLSKLTKVQIERVIDSMKIVNHKAGDQIFGKGTSCSQKIIIVIEGCLKKAKLGTVLATKGIMFGDEYLLEINKLNPKIFDDEIIVETDSVLSDITLEAFTEIIGGNIEEVIKKNENSRERKIVLKQDNSLKNEFSQVKIDSLSVLKKIGNGQFGSVFACKASQNDRLLALKCISKSQILDLNLEKFFIQQKAVLELVNFPFIVQFYRSFKDQYFIYFLSEYIKGMELFDVLREIGLLNSYDSQFYIASLILIMEYLHTNSIIYRDIKPENVMVDHEGYIKVIDMGTAKILKGKAGFSNRTFTIIGTPHYMAPEILTGKGYTMLVDLWSVGICLYEFMCGMVPFGEEADDPYEIYEEIIKKEIKYPSYLKDRKARKLMEQLLSKVPEARLSGSYQQLKANPWFENFDWDKLIDRELKAPFIPPKDKYIQESEIENLENMNKLVSEEIENDLMENEGLKKEINRTVEANWDKDF